jgi:hypothetical protein
VDVLGRFEDSSNQNPQEGPFLEREQEERDCLLDLATRGPGPTCAWHTQTVRDAPANSPLGVRTIWHPGADSPKLPPEHPVALRAFVTRANSRGEPKDGPPGKAGRSARLPRKVRDPLSFQLEILRDYDLNLNLLGS